MNKLYWQRTICIFFAFAIILQLAGCTSREEFYEQVTLSRDSAYQQWKNRKQREEQSQTIISGQLSMKDCIKLTLPNNKRLQSIVQEKEVARGEELKSYSAILPSVALSGNYTRQDKVTAFGPITIGDVDNYTAGLAVSQPIFDGGAMPAKVNAGKLFYLLADQTVRGAVQDVVYTAEHSYYDVLLNQHLFEISDDAVRSSQVHLNDVMQKRKVGVASDFDVLRAEVELSNFKADWIKTKNAIEVAKADLIKVMGVSQDSKFTLSDKLVYEAFEIAMEQAVEAAYHNRPDLFGRQIDIKLQKELLDIARSRYWPSINGFYGYTWANPDPHNPTKIEWGRAWDAGVAATLPLFDGFAREGDIISQKARFKRSQIDVVDTEETVLLELTKSIFSIKDAAEFVESQRMNLERAQKGLKLAEVGYREGTNTQVEVMDAQSALTKARAFYYQAIYSHIIAKLYLQKSMGTITTFDTDYSQNKSKDMESGK